MTSEFPIKTATACRLKWNWSTVFLHRETTSSCHRCKQTDLTVDNFQNFHNLPVKIADRENMLQGKWPGNGCEYCRDIEQAGGVSERVIKQDFSGEHTPHELSENPLATNVTPTTLEIYFNNICNMSCIYCGPYYSSVWEQELKKFGSIRIDSEIVKRNDMANGKNYDQLKQQLWIYLEKNYQHIKILQILGGEPFFQKEMDECLEFFSRHTNPEIKIVIFTNLKTSKWKLQKYIDKFNQLITDKQIGSLQITCSLDCWGPEAEYIRTGLDLKQWEENFVYILQQKEITVTVNAALTNIGLKTLPDLIEKIDTWNKINPVYFWFMPIVTPSYLAPNIFGKYFSKDLNRSLVKFDKINYLGQKDYFVGLIKEIYSNNQNLDEIRKLLIFLNEIDRRRDTDWRQIFPWLEKDYGHLCK